jgi:predicted ATP-binding protein involved in virulence
MRIDHLAVQNFCGFESREFSLNPQFNLLVGDNATGKTSILDALSIAVDTWFLGIKGTEKAGGIDLSQVRVEPHVYQDSVSFEKQFPSRIQTRGHVVGLDIGWARELRREKGKTTSVEARDLIAAASEADRKVRAREEISLPLICSYGTERLWFESRHHSKNKIRQDSSKQLPSRFDGYRDCNFFEIQETALLDWVRAEVSVSQQRQSETIALGVMKGAISGCVEGATSLYYDERYKDLIVVLDSIGHQMFRNLSDGLRIMLTLVGDLARRAVALNPQLGKSVLEKTSGIVLIDELDLHLHPKWQRHVIRDLKRTFPAIQFIATTHSPQLIGEAEPWEVIQLDSQQPPNPAQSFGMDSNWILKHVMGADERDKDVRREFEEIDRFIAGLKFEEAQGAINKLRNVIGNHPDLVRLSARIDRLAGTTK